MKTPRASDVVRDCLTMPIAQDNFTMSGRFRLFPLAPIPPPPKKEYKLAPEPANTEFRKEFPPDATIGSELDEAARVWKVYRKEAETFDKALLQGWSETLDILLIFAGLFSAVATAFVIESYQFLQLDNAAYAAAALYILVAASNHSTGITLPPPPDLEYKSTISRWINFLWFTSILLSLAVALLSILAKQWITEYRVRNNASAKSPKHWVLRREVYFQALNSWHVAEVVAFLPFLLHLSLFLFLVGVVAFLWTLDKAVGIWIIVLGGFLAVFYIACTLVPLWVPESPTSTPLSKQMRSPALALALAGLSSLAFALRLVQRLRSFVATLIRSSSHPLITILRDTCKRVLSDLTVRLAATAQRPRLGWILRAHTSDSTQTVDDSVFRADSELPATGHSKPCNTGDDRISMRLDKTVRRLRAICSDKSGIRHHLRRNCDKLEAAALHWLIVEVSDSDAVAVGLQALGALYWQSSVAEMLRKHDKLVDFPEETAFTRSSSGHTSTEVLRVVRTALCMSRQPVSISDRVPSLGDVNDAEYPDLALLAHRACYMPSCVAPWRESSPSLHSTALHLLRAENTPVAYESLALLLCCDLTLFSSADWDLALKAAASIIYVNQIPPFAKPFSFAVILGKISRWSNPVEPWVNPLLCRAMECIRLPDAGVRNADNFLGASALDLLSSQHFHDVTTSVPAEMITTILSYFPSNVYLAMLHGTGESIPKFWAAFACVSWRIAMTGPIEAKGCYPIAKDIALSVTALRKWMGSKRIRSAVLDAILLPPALATAEAQSLWALIPGRNVSRHGLFDIGDALAACLSICLRDGRKSRRTAVWIDNFFAHLPCRPFIVASSWVKGPDRDRLVHFMQHCDELRPQWLDGQDDDMESSFQPYFAQFRREVAQRGPCQSCPEHLGYSPLAVPREIAAVEH